MAIVNGQWQPDLFPRQWIGLQATLPGRRNKVLFCGPRKSTKCVSPATILFTGDGLIRIGALASPDPELSEPIRQRVLTMQNSKLSVEKATSFFNSGQRKALKLVTKNGYEIICSPNHPLWSEVAGRIEFREASNLDDSAWLPIVRKHPVKWHNSQVRFEFEWFSKNDAQSHRTSQKINALAAGSQTMAEAIRRSRSSYRAVKKWLGKPFEPKMHQVEVDEDLGYAIGLLVGDGCYTEPNLSHFRIGFSGLDYEINSALNSILAAHFPECSMVHEEGCNYTIQCAALRRFIEISGMGPKYAHEKSVPDFIIKSPANVIRAFLQGLFDTDGTVCKSGYARYCTASELLSKDVQCLLLAIGVRASRLFHYNSHRGYWIVRPWDEDDFSVKIGFRLLRKQSRGKMLVRTKPSRSSYPPSLVGILRDLHALRRSRGVGELPRKVHKHTIDSIFRGNVGLSKKRLVDFFRVLKCDTHSQPLSPYIMDWSIWWDRVVSISECDSPLVDISVPETQNFVGAGFINHNTWTAAHASINHLWRIKDDNFSLLTVTQSVGVDSGIWEKLTKVFIPEWIEGHFGFDWVKPPFVQGVTKKPTAIVRNQFGGESKVSLESLRTESEVEQRFKGKEFGGIWINELSKFKSRKTLDTLKDCLRGNPHMKPEDYLLLADTNPDLDLGTESWIYKLWYELRNDANCPEELKPLQDTLELVEFTVDDNLSMTAADKALLRSEYEHDQDVLQAYYFGKWVTASADAIFFKVFRPLAHILGEDFSANNQDPEMMFPEDNCVELHTGWDPGPVNCAACIIEAPLLTNGRPFIKTLDEHVIVGGDVKLDEFVEKVLEKMDFWEETLGREVAWTHHSDQSVFDQQDIQSKKFYHELIYEMSDGRIELIGTEKGPGSLPAGIDLTKQLLWNDRVAFNRPRCPKIIEAFKSIKRGKRQGEHVSKGSIHKHPYDAWRYAVQAICYDEIRWTILKNLRKTGESRLVSIPL